MPSYSAVHAELVEACQRIDQEILNGQQASRFPNFLSRRSRRRMSQRPGEDAHRLDRCDYATVRPMSRPAPCGRKESGDDGGRTRRGGGCHRCGGCGRTSVLESENQTKKQNIKKPRGPHVDHTKTTRQANPKLAPACSHNRGLSAFFRLVARNKTLVIT